MVYIIKTIAECAYLGEIFIAKSAVVVEFLIKLFSVYATWLFSKGNVQRSRLHSWPNAKNQASFLVYSQHN